MCSSAAAALRLEQAILNLLANAIKFNRPGGEVHVSASVNDRHQVAIVISDTGVGIPSQDLPRIFERFYRIDKARSRQVGGTGLGLSIVKHVVERMNGAIEVESTAGARIDFHAPIAGGMTVDPVCGMTVNPEKCAGSHTHKRQRIFLLRQRVPGEIFGSAGIVSKTSKP